MGNTATLSDDDLLARAHSLCSMGRKTDVQLILTLMEVESRRLYLRMAYSSMWDFCQRKLHMSTGQSYRRLTVARLARGIPSLLGHIEEGRVTICALVELRDLMTPANAEEIVAAIFGKTKAQLEKWIAAFAPRPDVPTSLRKLPTAPLPPSTTPPLLESPKEAPAAQSPLGAAVQSTLGAAQSPLGAAQSPLAAAQSTLEAVQSPLEAVQSPLGAAQSPLAGAQSPLALPLARRPRLEALSPSRFKLQMTVSEELREKMDRAKELMRHRNPSGDLAVVIEAAMEALLRELEHSRLAKQKSPPRTASTLGPAPAPNAQMESNAANGAPPAGTRAIPRAIRRAVFERDGERCTYVSASGDRCPARGHLELDHIRSRARGGTNELTNVRVRCRAHNKLHAEEDFGRVHIEDRVRFRQRKSNTRGVCAARTDADHARLLEVDRS